MNIDLHCHSTNSDGTWSVKQILVEAEKKKVKVLCISDHDNFKGSLEAHRLTEGVFSGILIPGIEISTTIEGHKVHLLAYFPSFELDMNGELFQNLEKIQNSRIWRMKEMIKRANQNDINVTFDEVLKEAGTGTEGDKQPTDVISRPHLARVLIKKGYATDFDEAFDKYLGDGKKLHVERFTLGFDDWIHQVQTLNGLTIWAHPLHGHEENLESLNKVAELLVGSKIDGIERIYNYKGKYTITEDFERQGEKILDSLIEQHNLLITSGGDFHGNVGVIGELDLPEDQWERFKAKLFKN